MSGFDELEARLRRYRPAGPPAGLRGRVMSAQRADCWRVWVPAAAAAIVALACHLWASSAYSVIARQIDGPRRDAERIVIARAAEALGGSELAEREAERLVLASEQPAPSTSGPALGGK